VDHGRAAVDRAADGAAATNVSDVTGMPAPTVATLSTMIRSGARARPCFTACWMVRR
jgi:hypothetical protein